MTEEQKLFVAVEVDGRKYVDIEMAAGAVQYVERQLHEAKARALILEVLLDEVLEFLDDQSDMVETEDGDQPNRALSLASAIRSDMKVH
jgi:hypothetical protein